MVSWNYFDKFDGLTGKYLPAMGEGETMATQAVTAICKLVYKWYNDGDVFDNTGALSGWCNDLSSYANWLRANIFGCADILDGVYACFIDGDYEDLLKDLADHVFGENLLARLDKAPKAGTVYKCSGPYRFEEYEDEDEEEY